MKTTREFADIPTICNANLDQIAEHILRPEYDRSDLLPGIIHIGVGNFHRAHQSWYLHRLFQLGLNKDWAIIGAGVRSADETQRQKLSQQDYLTTLIELDPSGISAEIVGSMIDFIPVVDGNGPLISGLTNKNIKIVSLTITEGGYYINPVTQEFDDSHEDIIFDRDHPQTPRTVFGVIIEALRQRCASGAGPFTIQSCDNLLGNGDVVKSTILSLARMQDAEFAEWIEANCTFPNSMVDCIVPASQQADKTLAQELGVSDLAPVTHENFRQWVIEDKFCAGRPDWDKVGATFSDNVHGYETQKIRVLNAGHQILANIGEIMNIETVSEAMAHPVLRSFFKHVQINEIVPHVKAVPGMTPIQYVELIEDRFANPAVVDTIRRIAFDGSSRHPGMVLPNVIDGLRNDVSIQGLCLVEAAWAHMCAGRRDDGSKIEANDPFWDDLQECAVKAKIEPKLWLEQAHIYADLANESKFVNAFSKWFTHINTHGVVDAMNVYLKTVKDIKSI